MRKAFCLVVALAAVTASGLHCTVTTTITPTFDAAPAEDASGTPTASDAGTSPKTDAAITTDASPSVDAGATPKLVFVTWSGYLGNLKYEGKANTGLEGADNLCNRSANVLGAAHPHGKFQAWLSTSTVDAIDHIVGNGPWYTYSGALAFANKAAIPNGPLAQINESENGNGIDLGVVGTGTFINGRKDSALNCADWTDSSSIYSFRYGVPNGGTTNWTSQGTRDCSGSVHLYCFEI